MRGAKDCAPHKCDCGMRLGEPEYGRSKIDWALAKWFRDPFHEQWHIHCVCGRDYVWSWHPASNGCWKIRSPLPLFDTKETVVIA